VGTALSADWMRPNALILFNTAADADQTYIGSAKNASHLPPACSNEDLQSFGLYPLGPSSYSGVAIAHMLDMKMITPRFYSAFLLAAALAVPVAFTPTTLRADDRKYHDEKHNDDHQWNDHEDRAYRVWAKENHRKYQDFNKLKAEDQQSYWGWRHEHSDALLKIDIR
jgi:hypothetical protein